MPVIPNPEDGDITVVRHLGQFAKITGVRYTFRIAFERGYQIQSQFAGFEYIAEDR